MSSNNRFFALYKAVVVGQIDFTNVHIAMIDKKNFFHVDRKIKVFKNRVRHIQGLITKIILKNVRIPKKYHLNNLSYFVTIARQHRTHCNKAHQTEVLKNISDNSLLPILQELLISYAFLLSEMEGIQKKYKTDKKDPELEKKLLQTEESWNDLLSYIKVLYVIFYYIEKDMDILQTQPNKNHQAGLALPPNKKKVVGKRHLQIVKT